MTVSSTSELRFYSAANVCCCAVYCTSGGSHSLRAETGPQSTAVTPDTSSCNCTPPWTCILEKRVISFLSFLMQYSSHSISAFFTLLNSTKVKQPHNKSDDFSPLCLTPVSVFTRGEGTCHEPSQGYITSSHWTQLLSTDVSHSLWIEWQLVLLYCLSSQLLARSISQSDRTIQMNYYKDAVTTVDSNPCAVVLNLFPLMFCEISGHLSPSPPRHSHIPLPNFPSHGLSFSAYISV